ncbi:MAG TPA: hypothetical protein VIK72_05555 [Clostridiaceae bacterium]
MKNLEEKFKQKRVIYVAVSIIIGIAIILFLVIQSMHDKSNVHVLLPMLGQNKQVVLDKLDINNAKVTSIGYEEYYTLKTGIETEEVIFTNGLCSGYRLTFNDVKSTTDELKATIERVHNLYGKEVLVASRLTSILSSKKGIESIKAFSRNNVCMGEWGIPENAEIEKILLRESTIPTYGLDLLVSLRKVNNDYLVTVKYVANRNEKRTYF